MVSVLNWIVSFLVSVQSTIWRQLLFLPLSLLLHHLKTHSPTLLPDITNSVYSPLWLFSVRPIRSISAPFEGWITTISPSPVSDFLCSVTSMNPFDIPRWICVQMCDFLKINLCFPHLLCVIKATAQFDTLLFQTTKIMSWVQKFLFWLTWVNPGLLFNKFEKVLNMFCPFSDLDASHLFRANAISSSMQGHWRVKLVINEPMARATFQWQQLEVFFLGMV